MHPREGRSRKIGPELGMLLLVSLRHQSPKDHLGTMCLHNSDDVIDSQYVLSRGIEGLQQTNLQDQTKSESSISKKNGETPTTWLEEVGGEARRLKSLAGWFGTTFRSVVEGRGGRIEPADTNTQRSDPN